MLVHAQREHVVAPPRSLNERQTASFGQKITQQVTGRPFAPGCGLLYSSIVVVGTHEQQPRECLPVQVES